MFLRSLDGLTREIIGLKKEIEEIKKKINTPKESNTTNTEQKIIKVRVGATLHPTSAIKVEDGTYDYEQNQRDRTRIKIEKFALLVNAIIFLVMAAQWKITRDTAVSAKNAIVHADRNAKVDQRPWVGLEGVGGYPEAGKNNQIIVSYINAGKTPAIDIRPYIAVEPIKTSEMENFIAKDCSSGKEGQGIGVLPPNIRYTPSFPTANWLPDLAKTSQEYVAHGCIAYRDIFEDTHWLTYCVSLMDNGKQWKTCSFHNETGDGEPPNR